MSANKQQILAELKQRDLKSQHGGISLLSVNSRQQQREPNNYIQMHGTPVSQVQRVIPIVQYVTTSPPPFVPQLIKPIQENSKQPLDQNFQSPSRNNSSFKNSIKKDSGSKNVSFYLPNSDQYQGDQQYPISNNKHSNSNSNNNSSTNNLIFQDNKLQNSQKITASNETSPQRVVQQSSRIQLIQNKQKELPQAVENQFLKSGNVNGLISARQSQQSLIKIIPAQKSVEYNLTPLRQVVSAFNTPIRKREDHLSIQQVQERINGGENEKTKEILLSADKERYKIFTDELLDQREKDLKRRIENLELQRNLIDDQLKFKEQQLEKVSSEHQQCSQRIQKLEQTLVDVYQEKEENEKRLNNNINQLHLIIQNLYEQNNKLLQQFQQANNPPQIQQVNQ
ncbi:hypothetical protein TTHERM_00688740 (macronuclear) [Tetrahymena thermophila SB210]|uniref:Uncharacterized protein n=1 Tax=Tetrahymena thermophila (strain SB210) TaxID=312017 RepID=I7M4F7_TETTS|nr:hypothetical protein TTHERM_00688740 [Tetrahymena thermophila SB210]EAS06734.1 hypothetical protein TTHERM_00688740 [Tetrahymena thermophila SB210]|eukprot:XP_001026976.1 hypothetical protein TTHERM_00688740 [Tetrahymena thermophila SB210]